MKLEALMKNLESYKPGTFVKLTWSRDVASAKARKNGIKITKECAGIVRLGINYANLKAVQKMVNSGDKKPAWYEHCGKGIVQHKNDGDKKYLQVFTVPGAKIKSRMILEYADVEPEVLYNDGWITKAAFNSEDLTTFTLNIENIKTFGGKN